MDGLAVAGIDDTLAAYNGDPGVEGFVPALPVTRCGRTKAIALVRRSPAFSGAGSRTPARLQFLPALKTLDIVGS